jgi:single-strand DNA-binding protein
MASSLNKVELIGRLGKDPEVKKLTNGSSVANFSVATSEVWKDKRSGEKQEKTEWHNIVVWNEKTIEFIEKYLAKGDLVRIEGKIQTRSWEKDGEKKYATEIVIPAFAPIEALMKLSFDNDNKSGGDRDGGNDRDSSRGSSRGGNSRSNDRDSGGDDRGDNDRGSSRGRGNTDDRGGDDRGSTARGGGRGDKNGTSDARGGGRGDDRDPPRRSAGGGRNADMDDDIPF